MNMVKGKHGVNHIGVGEPSVRNELEKNGERLLHNPNIIEISSERTTPENDKRRQEVR